MVQGAQDFNAHAFWHDVSRLEQINKRFFANDITIKKSFAIFLTNYSKYRFNDFSGSPIWKDYSMHDGKPLTTETLYFNTNQTTYKTKHKSFNAVTLQNKYTNLKWNDYKVKNYTDYEDKQKSIHPGLSYLILPVTPIK